MIFTSIASAGTMLNSGRVRLLGVTSPKRLTALPDVPPLSEVGLPGFDVALWYMVMAPASTPDPVVQLLSREIKSIVREPDVSKRIVALGAEVIDSPTPAELKTFLDSEIARWGKVITAAGLEKSM
jgi:tripartite-type tricarboxylate transporter receptor subunit TctC